jgi:hypothetical protein
MSLTRRAATKEIMLMRENGVKRFANKDAGKPRIDLSKYDDGFPDPEGFNAAISEASGCRDEGDFDEDSDLDKDDAPVDPFETLPEWDIIEHNLGI